VLGLGQAFANTVLVLVAAATYCFCNESVRPDTCYSCCDCCNY